MSMASRQEDLATAHRLSGAPGGDLKTSGSHRLSFVEFGVEKLS